MCILSQFFSSRKFIFIALITMYFSKSHFQPQGKCALVVGASQGLGAELGRQLYARGCTVILVARTEAKLKSVVAEIEKEKFEAGDPKALYIAADVSKYDQCLQLWQQVDERGLDPDFIFCCAGSTVCKLFEDLTGADLAQGVNINYMTALNVTHSGFRHVLSKGAIEKKRHVIFFSSIVSFFTFAGYSQYAPLKSALESLSISLRHEMGPYGYRISCVFAGNFASEGFAEEQKTKPQITKDIEGPSKPIPTEECAEIVIDRLSKGYDSITTHTIGWLLGCSVLGMRPRQWGFFQIIVSFLFLLIAPIANWVIYRDVEKYYKKRSEAKKTK
jgi:short-subunit dehydrogenase